MTTYYQICCVNDTATETTIYGSSAAAESAIEAAAATYMAGLSASYTNKVGIWNAGRTRYYVRADIAKTYEEDGPEVTRTKTDQQFMRTYGIRMLTA